MLGDAIAAAQDGAKATVFLVDKDLPGVRLVRTPKYSHTFVFEHPIFAFEGVRVGPEALLGEIGGDAGVDVVGDVLGQALDLHPDRLDGAAARSQPASGDDGNAERKA